MCIIIYIFLKPIRVNKIDNSLPAEDAGHIYASQETVLPNRFIYQMSKADTPEIVYILRTFRCICVNCTVANQ